MSKQSAARRREASQPYEEVQDHPVTAEPRSTLDAQRRITEYEAADRNAEMIEEMAEDIEIAEQFQGPRRVQLVLQLSKARTRGQRSIHRRANPVESRPERPGF